MNRRLYRCRYDRRIAGVAGGVAEYFDLDPTLVRVLWFVSIFFGGFTLAVYVGLWLIMPLEPELAPGELHAAHASAAGAAAMAAGPTAAYPGSARAYGSALHRHDGREGVRWSLFIGWALVLFGALALADVLLPDLFSWREVWPLFFVGVGALLIVGTMRRETAGGSPTAGTTRTETSGTGSAPIGRSPERTADSGGSADAISATDAAPANPSDVGPSPEEPTTA